MPRKKKIRVMNSSDYIKNSVYYSGRSGAEKYKQLRALAEAHNQDPTDLDTRDMLVELSVELGIIFPDVGGYPDDNPEVREALYNKQNK